MGGRRVDGRASVRVGSLRRPLEHFRSSRASLAAAAATATAAAATATAVAEGRTVEQRRPTLATRTIAPR